MSTPPNRTLSPRVLSVSPSKRLQQSQATASSAALSPTVVSPFEPPVELPVDDADEEDGGGAELPLTMAASVVLTSLPIDAKQALREASAGMAGRKVTIRLRPLGSSPALKQSAFKLTSTSSFATVIRFLRKRLSLQPHQTLCCYVGQSFSPSLDEEVGGLYDCFKTADELVVQYALTPTFG